MDNLAEKSSALSPGNSDRAAIRARAEMLRATIAAIPSHQLAAVFNEIRDVLPPSLFDHPKAPQRGGDTLNNVYDLFKQDPGTQRGAPEVKKELAKAGKPADAQPIRNALNYLSQRRVPRRVGYGLYQLSDGSFVEGLP